jgi:hypothetical protein
MRDQSGPAIAAAVPRRSAGRQSVTASAGLGDGATAGACWPPGSRDGLCCWRLRVQSSCWIRRGPELSCNLPVSTNAAAPGPSATLTLASAGRALRLTIEGCRSRLGRTRELERDGGELPLFAFVEVALDKAALHKHRLPRCVRSGHPDAARNDGPVAPPPDETRVRADAEPRLLQPPSDAEAGSAKDLPSFGLGNAGRPNRRPELCG